MLFKHHLERSFFFVRYIMLPITLTRLGTQRSEEYFRRTKELSLGRPLVSPVGAEKAEQWAKFRDVMSDIDECISKTDAKGPFVMGDTVSWADFFLGAFLMYIKNIKGEDSEEWKDVASWNEGRWKNLLHALGDQPIN